MRLTAVRLLIVPIVLFLVLVGAGYLETRWQTALNDEMRYAAQTLAWTSGAWLLMRLIRVFAWQQRAHPLSGAAPPVRLQHTVNLFILMLTAAGIAHSVFEQPLTGFWATSGVVGIILGVALRGIIADFFSGIALEWDPPFRVGDYIELRAGGEPLTGRVTEVSWRATKIVPRDSPKTVWVPNSLMASIALDNVYEPLGKTRFELFLSLDPQIPHDRVVRILMSAVKSIDGIAQDVAPEVVAARYNAAGVEYIMRYWLTPEVSPTSARNRLMAAVMELARRCDLHVAFPRQDVVFGPKPEAVTDPLKIKIGFLERNAFFGSCRPEELKTIATHLHTRQYPAGTRIVTFGAPGNSLFLISEGLVEITIPHESEHRTLLAAKLLAGDFFGEMSLLTDEPCSATVTAVTETVVYEIRRHHIHDLVSNRPEIADSMSHIAADRRLRNQNAELACDSEAHSDRHQDLKDVILDKMRSLFALLHD